jgi:carboxylesterase
MSRPADPFALGAGPDACLLLHGLTGAPSEMRPVGEALAAAGFRAVGPLLPGHGTKPEDLDSVTRFELLDAARSALLSLRGARQVFLCGLSAGALLSIHLAARGWAREGLPRIPAIALLAPAIEFRGSTWVFTQLVGRLPVLPLVIGKGGRDLQQQAPPPRAEGSYDGIPLRWGRELRLLSAEALALAPRVRAPALILQGALDSTVSPAGSRRLASKLASASVDFQLFQRSGHVLPLDVEQAEVCSAVVKFFQRFQQQQGS